MMSVDHQASPRGYNFLGLPPEDAAYDTARVVVIPVAYDGTTSYRAGTKYGPAAIIAASREVETYDPVTKRDIAEIGIATVDEIEAEAEGPGAMVDTVERVIAGHLAVGKYCVMLGGEHSITTGAVRAHTAKYPDLTVLQIDAHADMRDTYQGSKWSHACAMRRVRELCPAVSVGIRNVSADCHATIERDHLPIFWSRDCVGKTDWYQAALKPLSKHVYITIDLDGLDPSIMPAVGTPEPGGLLWQETLDFLRLVFAQKTVVGFDVVELSPIPGLHAPDFLAARLVAEMLRMIRF
ncbi:MAG: agmatinase [Candidatus Zixiibacteriota bacterium]